jgi:hypothetical protein
MIRKLMMIGMLATFLSATTTVFAEDVFITQRGSKYHKEICRLVKNKDNITTLDKKEAVEEDYGPCKRCFKEDVVVEENQE